MNIFIHNLFERFYGKQEDLEKEWLDFKVKYGKDYVAEEEKTHKEDFKKNRDKIKEHNAAYERKQQTFKLEMNEFGDMSFDEFEKAMTGFKGNIGRMDESIMARAPFDSSANVELPDQVDWNKAGAVTGVKEQKKCGSCWAFSATGALEGQHFRKTGVLVPLSAQNLIDCSWKYGNEGCNGGYMNKAFKYVMERGIATETSYPYEAKVGTCRYKLGTSNATAKGIVQVAEGNERELQEAVATVGPISVGIDATHPKFRFYETGVYYEPDCKSPNNLNHAVLVVGYGTDKSTGQEYWLVKNSWGTKWGEKGYIRMARNQNNNCGIASAASYPLV